MLTVLRFPRSTPVVGAKARELHGGSTKPGMERNEGNERNSSVRSVPFRVLVLPNLMCLLALIYIFFFSFFFWQAWLDLHGHASLARFPLLARKVWVWAWVPTAHVQLLWWEGLNRSPPPILTPAFALALLTRGYCKRQMLG